jgi:hypothetical protein
MHPDDRGRMGRRVAGVTKLDAVDFTIPGNDESLSEDEL